MAHKIDLIEWDDRAKGKFPLLEELKQLRAVNADLLVVLKALLDAAYDTEATGVPCVTLEPAMQAAEALIIKAEAG